MIVHEGYKDVPPAIRGGVVAIGNFDGVHKGHQALIGEAVKAARERSLPAGVMIFEPHPREFFHPNESHFRLTPLDQKIAVFETMGLDFVVVVPFDAELAKLEHFEFTDNVLAQGLDVRGVVVGYDFYYGRQRRGSPESMILAGIEYDFEVVVVPPVAEGGEVFSSTAIRFKLAQGDVAGAAVELGRRWRVRGRVIGGAKRGTGMGYPTANVPMPKGTALGHGIYAVRAHVGGAVHDAAAYLGTRPTFDDGMPVLEVFLLDFDGDLYGQEMEVEFIAFIREDRKFDSAEALVQQMDADVAKVRDVLAGTV
ncbi:MAG: bifunctional riboflavin kinase/FMN adenylyltransferase [Hyphomicrobium sp.]|nr:bifunctional riboflavin kinase/FMN adenylyltransferase [Hyphomicrobium sp.]PPD09431.1 MAG: bifunctional riboflavin kinase/FMN adenylyltransferase [Hyphomicrobium sp.]